jgi:hypothetical protein
MPALVQVRGGGSRRFGQIGHSSTCATSTLTAMPGFDPQQMVARFRARAEAVRTRGMPPIEGPERQRFREQAQQDFTDYAMIGDAEAELVDGILTLRIDLRPPAPAGDDARLSLLEEQQIFPGPGRPALSPRSACGCPPCATPPQAPRPRRRPLRCRRMWLPSGCALVRRQSR